MSTKSRRHRGPNKSLIPRSLRRLFPNLKDVEDAKEGAVVTVRNRDTQEGKKMRPSECAMARAAVREHLADAAVIGLSYSYLIKGNKATRFKTSEAVAREITSFDRHHDFAPGSYSLQAVPPSSRLGADKRSHGDDHGDQKRHKPIIHKGGTVRVRSMR
jgi:hypothetical protein